MERMEDLPMNPFRAEREIARLEQELAREKARNTRSPAKRTTTTRKRTTVKKTTAAASRPKKSLPAYRLPGEQPRGPDGRWIKAGKVAGKIAKGVLFGTARVIGGTAAAVHEGYKTVKRVRRKGRANGKKEGLVTRKKVRRRKR